MGIMRKRFPLLYPVGSRHADIRQAWLRAAAATPGGRMLLCRMAYFRRLARDDERLPALV